MSGGKSYGKCVSYEASCIVITKMPTYTYKDHRLELLYKATEDAVNARIKDLATTYYKKNFVVLDISDYQIEDDLVKVRIVYQYNAAVDDQTRQIVELNGY